MMNDLKEKLRSEVTPIVAYGFIAISFILAYLAIGNISSRVSVIAERLNVSKSELLILQELEEQDVWSARLAQSNKMKEELNSRLWSGTTSGIISAELQQMLRESNKGLSKTALQINVDPSTERIGDVLIINFDARSRSDNAEAAIEFIGNISQNERDIYFKEASIRMSSSSTADVNIRGYIPIQILEVETNE